MTTVRIPVFDERRGRFARLQHKRVLIYWPHGLGDWAHLSLLLPFLERTNRYAVTRYGDDYVALMDGNAYVTPVYTGVRRISDGSDAGARHLGVDFKRIDGGTRMLQAPRLEEAFSHSGFDAVLYTDYPEREGRTKFPFHTKARALLRDLARLTPEDAQALQRPLKSTVSFEVDASLRTAVEQRLREFIDPGERLVLLSPAGHTAARKNWNPAEVERLGTLAAGDTSRWKFFSFEQHFRELFAQLDAPFALILKALLRCADLVIGVPTGPLHVALAYANVPVAGIWLAHHPDWYEERSENAVHLLAKNVFDREYDRRPATTTLPPQLRNRTIGFRDSAQIDAGAVWQAARELLR